MVYDEVGAWSGRTHPRGAVVVGYNGKKHKDDVVIGLGAMIHGFHLGAGTVVQPAAIVCDSSRVGACSIARAGAMVDHRPPARPARPRTTRSCRPARPAGCSPPPATPNR